MSSIRFVIICVMLLAIGARTQADLGVDWQQATASPAWHERTNHATVVFKNRIWIMGGSHDNNSQNLDYVVMDDVWSSADGSTWELEALHAPWGPRSNTQVVEFNDKLWLLGGTSLAKGYQELANDVWSSSDGVHWTQELTAAPWRERRGHRAVVFDNKIWVMGGAYEATNENGGGQTLSLNDVWSSSDGQNWTQVTVAADWSARQGNGAVVCKDRMWVIGGYSPDTGRDLSDVWSSADGLTWRKETENAPWGPRECVSAIVSSGCLWLLGGTDSSARTKNDVWVSRDGKSWLKVTDAAPWPERSGCTPLLFGSKLFVIGGWHYTDSYEYGTYLKDVWSSREQPVLALSPNGGEYLPIGDYYEVQWKTDPSVAGTAVKVELWNSTGWVAELGSDSDPSGTHTFKTFFSLVPTGSDYRIRVISQADPTLFDDSDMPFIMAFPIRMIWPNGGEVLHVGQTIMVQWQTSINMAGTAVRLELWNRDGMVADLGNSYAEDGNGVLRVTLPTVIASTDYRIRAVSLWQDRWTDASDADFVILKAPESAVEAETWTLYR